ncbi:MAG: AMP-binding protein [Candidatus Zixiibacteriota bacterium]|nr:MAG: AMP-binding protein [candidate division Zixibacteria bacterium]
MKADGGRGKTYTYAQLADLIGQVAAGLSRAELSGYREIGLLSENRPEWGIAYLAITAAGKTVVPIDANLKPAEMAYIIEHADLKAIFVSAKFEKILNERYDHLRLFTFDDDSPDFWLNIAAADTSTIPSEENQVAVLIFTSGTTGDPKAVQLTHRNLLANIAGIDPALPFGKDDTFLCVLPLHHTFEATCGFLVPLMSGSTIVYARSLKSNEIREDIAANSVTVMCGVPLLYEKLYHSVHRKIQSAPAPNRILFKVLFSLSGLGWKMGYKWGKLLFRSLRNKGGMDAMNMFVSGGAALPPNICRFFNLLGLDLLQGYGMTECSPVISVNRPDDIKFGSVGPPLSNVQISIEDPGEGGVGEILVKSDAVTPGYKDNPEETAQLIRDSWLYTGDLGYLRDGHLWITGRKKNLIVSAAGKNIYPEQIEEALLESPYIMETVVFGRAKESRQGEQVCAVIVPDLDQFKTGYGVSPGDPDMELINRVIGEEVARINSSMTDYKRVKDFRVQIEELEKTSTKKVRRFVYK